MTRKRSLDQAIDRFSQLVDSTAYEEYLQGDYRDHREARRRQWDEHYDGMDTALGRSILRVIDEGRIRLSDLNIMIIGPGFSPVHPELDRHNEISRKTVNLFLKRVNSIVMVDISQKVALSAKRSLVNAGVDESKIFPMQYDVTDALSTLYLRKIQELLNPITTEEQLQKLSEDLEDFSIQSLEGDVVELSRKMADENSIVPPERLLDGGVNGSRTMRLTVNGDPLPMHLIAYQMVLAGTGAAAEAHIWDKFDEVTSDEDRGARNSSDPEIAIERWIMRGNFHSFIASYNTYIAVRTIRKAIIDNLYPGAPPPRCVAYTDVNTTYVHNEFGEMPRLNTEVLKNTLANVQPRIITSVQDPSFWADEPDHGHGTRVITFKVSEKAQIEPINQSVPSMVQ